MLEHKQFGLHLRKKKKRSEDIAKLTYLSSIHKVLIQSKRKKGGKGEEEDEDGGRET